jgi:hypothetical protein
MEWLRTAQGREVADKGVVLIFFWYALYPSDCWKDFGV